MRTLIFDLSYDGEPLLTIVRKRIPTRRPGTKIDPPGFISTGAEAAEYLQYQR